MTLPDINKLSGQAADIYYMLSPKNLISSYKPVEIQTTKTSDNKYLPKSSLGLKLLSVYANYEKLFNFSKKLGVEKNIEWPLKVVVDATVGSEGFPVELGLQNTIYFSSYSGNRVPPYLNPGLIAQHEFLRLFSPKKEGMPFKFLTPSKDVVEVSQDKYNRLLFGVIQEGLASYFGYIFSGSEDFHEKSYPNINADKEVSRVFKTNMDMDWLGADGLAEFISRIENPTVFSKVSTTLDPEYLELASRLESIEQIPQALGRIFGSMVFDLSREMSPTEELKSEEVLIKNVISKIPGYINKMGKSPGSLEVSVVDFFKVVFSKEMKNPSFCERTQQMLKYESELISCE